MLALPSESRILSTPINFLSMFGLGPFPKGVGFQDYDAPFFYLYDVFSDQFTQRIIEYLPGAADDAGQMVLGQGPVGWH